MEWYETAFGRIYPALYRHRDENEAELVLESFGDLLEGRGPILDLACGDGRYMAPVTRRGVTIWGVDLSEFLLEEAVSRRGLAGSVVRADMRRLPFGTGTFGTVLNMFTSFGYFEADMDNLMVFHEISRVLKDGGVLLFDFLNAAKVVSVPPAEKVRVVDDYTVRETYSLGSGARFLIKHVAAANRTNDGLIEYDERIRLYKRDELITMLDSVDLGVSGVFGDYDRTEFRADESERFLLICEKRMGVERRAGKKT